MNFKSLPPALGLLLMGPGCFGLLIAAAWANHSGYKPLAWLLGMLPVALIVGVLAASARSSSTSGDPPDPRD